MGYVVRLSCIPSFCLTTHLLYIYIYKFVHRSFAEDVNYGLQVHCGLLWDKVFDAWSAHGTGVKREVEIGYEKGWFIKGIN